MVILNSENRQKNKQMQVKALRTLLLSSASRSERHPLTTIMASHQAGRSAETRWTCRSRSGVGDRSASLKPSVTRCCVDWSGGRDKGHHAGTYSNGTLTHTGGKLLSWYTEPSLPAELVLSRLEESGGLFPGPDSHRRLLVTHSTYSTEAVLILNLGFTKHQLQCLLGGIHAVGTCVAWLCGDKMLLPLDCNPSLKHLKISQIG